MSSIIQYFSICDCLISLSIMSSTFIHVVAWVRIFFLLRQNNIQFSVYIIFLFFHSSINGHMGYFHLLTIVNNVTINISVQIALWDTAFNSFGYNPMSSIAGSHGNSIFKFFFWGIVILFSMVAAPFYIPTRNV